MSLLRRDTDEDDDAAAPRSPDSDEETTLVFEGETLSHSPRLLQRAYRRMRGDE